MNNLDYYNTAAYLCTSHWGGVGAQRPLYIQTFTLQMWRPVANVAYNTLISMWWNSGVCLTVRLHVQYDQHSRDGTIFTYWPKSVRGGRGGRRGVYSEGWSPVRNSSELESVLLEI